MMSLVPSRRSFLAGFGSLLAAPALVRADSLMPVRSIARLLLPQFNYDSFDALKPAGVEYQWVTKLVMGENLGNLDIMRTRGWNPVPAARFKNSFAVSGAQIEYGDCVLMERSRAECDAAREHQASVSRNLIEGWVEQNEKLGFDVMIRHSPAAVEYVSLYGEKRKTLT